MLTGTTLCELLEERKEFHKTLCKVVPIHSLRPRGDHGRVKPVIVKKTRYFERSQLPNDHPDNVCLDTQRILGVTWMADQVKKGNFHLDESQLTAIKKTQQIMEIQKALNNPEAKVAIAEAKRHVFNFVLREIEAEANRARNL